MSYSADERLPEDYFKGVMEEKAEMLRKYLKDLGDPLVFSCPIVDTQWQLSNFIHMMKKTLSNYIILSQIWETWRISCTSYGYNSIMY